MSRLVDISGQRFGRLTVVHYKGNSKWECICDCGKTTIVRGADLKSGNSKSCGCAHYGYSSPSEFVGKHFGELLVTEIIDSGREGHIKCKCICSCGSHGIFTLSQLRRGTTVSCGCHKRKISSERMKKRAIENSKVHIGDRFGSLVVLSRDESKKSGRTSWVCQCDCGAYHSVEARHLLDGNTKSCGCLMRKHQYTKSNILAAQAMNPVYQRKRKYEKISGGPISKDEYIISLDGDISNMSEDNLMAIRKQTYNSLSRRKLLGRGNITKTAVLIDELERKIIEVCS